MADKPVSGPTSEDIAKARGMIAGMRDVEEILARCPSLTREWLQRNMAQPKKGRRK